MWPKVDLNFWLEFFIFFFGKNGNYIYILNNIYFGEEHSEGFPNKNTLKKKKVLNSLLNVITPFYMNTYPVIAVKLDGFIKKLQHYKNMLTNPSVVHFCFTDQVNTVFA